MKNGTESKAELYSFGNVFDYPYDVGETRSLFKESKLTNNNMSYHASYCIESMTDFLPHIRMIGIGVIWDVY